MGARGPAPARSDQRRRRNEPSTPTGQVEVDGKVEAPAADEGWHSAAREWYESLADSGQSRFYEPSDWRQAHYCAELMSQSLREDKINAQLVAQVRGLMTDLLVTEGARRRAGMEIVRASAAPEAAPTADNVTAMDARRKRVVDAS